MTECPRDGCEGGSAGTYRGAQIVACPKVADWPEDYVFDLRLIGCAMAPSSPILAEPRPNRRAATS